MGAPAAVIGAQATMSAVSAMGQRSAAKSQYITDKATVSLDTAQKQFQVAKTAATEAEQFRRNLAKQTALSAYRGTSGARQFGGQSFATFSRDLQAIDRANNILDVRSQNAMTQAKATRGASTLSAYTGFGQSILAPASTASYSKYFG